MKVKFSLTRRFTYTTIAILVVVSSVYFAVYKHLYVKNTEHLVEQLQASTERSLQQQLYRRGEGLGLVLSNNLFDAVYTYNIELVYQLMKPVIAIEEVNALHVVDKKGFIFHDGQKDLLLFAEPHPRIHLLLSAMEQRKQIKEFMPQGIIFAIPIIESEAIVGAIYMELSSDKLSKDIDEQYDAIEIIRQRDENRFFLLQVIVSIILMYFASLITWLFARNLVKPLNHLIVELRNDNDKDEFVAIAGGTRSDEIGLLTRAYNEMGQKINKRTAAIQKMAYHDALTQLPNRNKFVDHIQSLIQQTNISDLHLFFVDLDEFKTTNDNFGHAIGDAMLITVAKRLDELIRFHSRFNSGKTSFDNNMVARIGGDEFVIAVVNAGPENAGSLGDIILNSLRSYLNLNGNQLVVSGSVGVSCFPGYSDDAESLIKEADIAMYYAKSQGKNGCSLFSQAMKTEAENKAQIEQELKYALNDLSQFELWYQPKVSISTQKLIGAEALVRWKHPTRGYIFPDLFIPLAEKSDIILDIGEALILQLGEHLDDWQETEKIDESFHVALNISARQIYRQDIVSILKKVLLNHRLSPERIQFEVTESLLLSDKKLVDKVLTSVQAMGITVWLDDFGTGYSSLSYLQSFRFDGVKIDRTFVQDIESNEKNQNLVKAIISLANTLEIDLVVEGIETEQQAEVLQAYGCEKGQGYYYARPLSKHQFEQQWLL